MTGYTYRDACLLQSALLRERAQQIAEHAEVSMPVDKLVDVLSELHDLQEQVDELEEFMNLLDDKILCMQSFRVGLPN